MYQQKQRAGSRKRLLVFKQFTNATSPKKEKGRLPVFQLLTSGLTPSTRVLLKETSTGKKVPNILDIANKLHLNTKAKTFKPTKGKGKSKSKGKKKGKGSRKKR